MAAAEQMHVPVLPFCSGWQIFEWTPGTGRARGITASRVPGVFKLVGLAVPALVLKRLILKYIYFILYQGL